MSDFRIPIAARRPHQPAHVRASAARALAVTGEAECLRDDQPPGGPHLLRRIAIAVLAAIAALCATASTTAHATSFVANQNASLQLGASSFTSTTKNGRLDRSFETPEDVFLDGSGRIWVADSETHRIAMFGSMPAADGAAMSVAIGDPTTQDYRQGCSSTRMSLPTSVSIGGGRMAVADRDNHRILLYDSVPTTSGAAASRVVGQTAFTNCGSNVSSIRLQKPSGVWTDGTKLVVADRSNQRVMIWNSWPTSNGQAADLVLGQPDFTSNTTDNPALTEAARFDDPMDVWSDGTRLLVVDMDNRRVLVWTSWPTTNGQAANHVIGQTSFTNTGGSCSATRLNNPQGVFVTGSTVLVADSGNHRVVAYEGYGFNANGPSATRVLGQTSLTSCSPNRGNASVDSIGMVFPTAVWSDGTRVLATDSFRHRVLAWTSWPGSNGAAPQRIIGQPDGSQSGAHSFQQENAFQAMPWRIGWQLGTFPFILPNGGLLVGSSQYNRMSVHTSAPTSNNQAPDWFIGQASATSSDCNGPDYSLATNGALRTCGTRSSWSDGTRLVVTEHFNHRVKIWNTFPTSASDPPDVVLGQTSFSTRSMGTSASTLSWPAGIASDGTRLFVSDEDNHRILIWNSWPTTHGQPADVVLGQPDFTSWTSNNGGRSASSLVYPNEISIHKGKLAVADWGNHRILIWDTLPTTNNQPADTVIGQSSFTTASTSTDTYRTVGVVMTDNTIFFNGSCGAYYLDPIPTGIVTSGWSPIGTPCGGDTPTQSSITSSWGISARAGKVWVSDDHHARLLRFDDTANPTITLSPTVTTSCTGTTFTWSTNESGTAEVYWGPTSQATVGGYPNSSIRTEIDGLTQTHTVGEIPAGTYFYRVRTVDGGGNEVVSAESSFTITVSGVTSLFSHDTNAQSGTSNNVALTSPTPRLSFVNDTSCASTLQRTQVVTTPLDANVVRLWQFDGNLTDATGTQDMRFDAPPGSPTYGPSLNASMGQAAVFDGVDDGADISDRADLRLDEFTLEAWFRTTDISGSSFPLISSKHNSGTEANYLISFVRSTHALRGLFSAGGVTYQITTPAGPYIDGHWHHVALTANGSKEVRLYVDGVQVGSTVTYVGTIDKSNAPLRIGRNSSGNMWFKGSIDEVRLSNVARSAAEIAGYYRTRQPHYRTMWDSDASNAGVAQTSCSHGARCADVTYGTGGGSAQLTGGRYYARQKQRGSSSVPWSAWASWDWFEQRLGRPVNLYVDDSNAQTGQANRTGIANATPRLSWMNTSGATVDRQRVQVLTTPLDDVVGLWPLDGNGGEMSGNGNALTLSPAPADPAWAPGQDTFGSALTFDGVDDRATIAHHASTLLDEFTVEAWFRTNDISNSAFPNIVLGNSSGSSNRNFGIMFYSAANELHGELSAGGSYYGVVVSAAPYVDGQWHHVALTADENKRLRMYVDGVQVGSTVTYTGTIDKPATPIYIGATSTSTAFFEGSIDDVRISSRARTAAEIAGYYATRRPHYQTMWDSDTSDAGVVLTSCADRARCTDVTYGTGGTPSGGLELVRDGARYYARAKLRPGAGAWTHWSTWDWFETGPPVTTLTTTGCQSGTANVTDFGSMFPGTARITSSDCNIGFGSSSNTALLRMYQTDLGGDAMLPQPASGVVGYWPLNQSLTDASSTSASMALTGTSWTSGAPGRGQALYFTGASGNVGTIPHGTALDLSDDFTVDVWFSTTGFDSSSTGWQDIVLKQAGTSGNDRNFHIGFEKATGNIGFSVSSGGVLRQVTTAGSSYLDGGWHHAALVVRQQQLEGYVDGVRIAGPLALGGPVDVQAAAMTVGNNAIDNSRYAGAIDELRVHNVPRTAAELRSYYAGRVHDYRNQGDGSDTDWSAGHSMFAACLRSTTNAAATAPWTGTDTCSQTDNGSWQPIAATGGAAAAKIASTAVAGTTNAGANLRFGTRLAADTPPGSYRAPVVIEVIAPDM